MFFTFLLFLKFHLVLNQIKFNIKRDFPKEPTREQIIENFFYNNLTTEILVGTPPQKFNLLIQIREYSTVILSESCPSEPAVTKFKEKESSSFKPEYLGEVQTYAIDTYSNGYSAFDQAQIGELTYDIQFILALNSSLRTNSGIIGLNPNNPKGIILKGNNLINNLKKKDLIESYAFTIKMKDTNQGEVIIGKYPHFYDKKFKRENLIMTKIINSFRNVHWGFKLDKVTYNGTDVNSKNKNAIIYLESDAVYAPMNFIEEAKKNFFQKYLDEGICEIFRMLERQWIICDKKINTKEFKEIRFYNADLNYTFVLNHEDLFETFGNKVYFKVCFENIEKVEDYWFLGTPFLKKYQMVFDQDKRMIGLYIEEKSSTFRYEWIIIFSLVVACIVLVFLLRRKFKFFQKNKGIELVERYPYDEVK